MKAKIQGFVVYMLLIFAGVGMGSIALWLIPNDFPLGLYCEEHKHLKKNEFIKTLPEEIEVINAECAFGETYLHLEAGGVMYSVNFNKKDSLIAYRKIEY